MKRVAIFASGNGSNAQNLIEWFSSGSHIEPVIAVTNNPNAYVVERAKVLGIETLVLSRAVLQGGEINTILEDYSVDYIILAGYLLMIPASLINRYKNRIINIHPALLPKFGGKGMYGNRVHEAVVAAKESESGITIHLVDEVYDNGEIIFKAKCAISESDTAQDVASKVSMLEQKYFPMVVEDYILTR